MDAEVEFIWETIPDFSMFCFEPVIGESTLRD